MSDAVLIAERRHLEDSRLALARMKDQAADWQTATGGDHVSTQYLRQMLHRRVEQLTDTPDAPLFFGRLDFSRRLGAPTDETCHIGRRHVTTGPGSDPLVIDWRAPISRAFYQARAADPMGVALRRRFGFQAGQLTAYEDEDLSRDSSSDLLEAEIERPRTGPMRDIVATIQPDQDELVRIAVEHSMCIQGAPGTGKTAVGLHRVAYLLYTYRERLTKAGVLVIGPTEGFLDYIGDVLPALGEIEATQTTIDSLVCEATQTDIRAEDSSELSSLKGEARMAEILHRAVWRHLQKPTETLVVPHGHRQWRIPAPQLADSLQTLIRRQVRYLAGREMLGQRLAHEVLVRMEAAGDITDDRLQHRISRCKEVRHMVDLLWPKLSPASVLHRLYSDPVFLSECAEGILTAEEQLALSWVRPPRTPRSARWTLADVVLLDEVSDLLNRTPSLGHVIVDEAQDLSAMQLRAVGRRVSTGSVTLLGDLAQATTPWASTDWTTALGHLGRPEAEVKELVEGFRVPGDVLSYAARLLPIIAPALTPPRPMRRSPGDLQIQRVSDVPQQLPQILDTLAQREGTIGVILPDTWESIIPPPEGRRIQIVPASLAKGLEFDHVVVAEPADIVAAEPNEITGLRRLYVCLTRPISSLLIVHTRPLPSALR